MPAIQYLLESAFCLACLYAFYWLALRRQTFFQWNRAYLMLAPVLALLIPALTISFDKPAQLAAAGQPEWPVLVEYLQTAPRFVENSLQQPVWSLSLGELLWGCYLAIAAVLTIRLLHRAIRLADFIYRHRYSRRNGLTLVSGPDGAPLASFFGYILWHPHRYDKKDHDMVFEHELAHARQWHSLDLLWMEALIVLQWFNPLLYAYRRSLRAVHEYIADDHVVRHTRRRYAYATLLAQSHQESTEAHGLLNTFHSLVKNRLIMLAKLPSHPFNRLRYLLALLLCFVLLGLFSFRLVDRVPLFSPIQTVLEKAEQYAGELREVTVLAEKNMATERTPYIFYWGQLTCYIEKDPLTDKYKGILRLKPVEFRQSVNREPRMWNGQSLETHLSFELNGLLVRSNYDLPEVYGAGRQKLQDFAFSIKPGVHIDISRLGLPNGRNATVTLLFDDAPEGYGPKAPSETVWSEPGNNTAFGMEWGYFTWGNYLHSQKRERDFFTAAEFWNMIASPPQHYREDGEPSQLTYCSVTLLPLRNGDALEISLTHDRNDATVYERHKMRLNDLFKNELRPDVFVYVEFRKTPGDVAISGGVMRIVEDNNPALELRHDHLHKYTFEWGSFARAEPMKYGRAFPDKNGNLVAVDKNSRQSVRMPLDEVKKMLGLTPYFWEDDDLLNGLQFRVQYQEFGAEYAGKAGLPGIFKQEVLEKLRINDTLTLTNFVASGRNLTRHTIEIIAGENDPKPRLAVRNKSAQLKTVRLNVRPNPAHDQATVDITLPEAGQGLFTVTDAMGVVRFSLETDFHAGITPFKLPLAQIKAKGALCLRLDMPYGSGQTVLIAN